MAKTEFNKITAVDIGNKGVIGLPDTPGLETEEMQKKFEEVVRDVVIVKFNEFIDKLNEQFGTDITAIGDGTVTGAISSLNGRLTKYVDIGVKCGAETWCTALLPESIPNTAKIINVCRQPVSDANVYGVIWFATTERIFKFFRIDTNGTNLVVNNTAGTVKLRIWYNIN